PTTAAGLYDRVSRTNPSFTTATFGLARSRLKLGDRAGAVAAFERVPPTSSRYVAAQLALARTLVDSSVGPPGIDELGRASDILGGLTGQDVVDSPEVNLAAADLFMTAVRLIEAGGLSPNGTRLLGRECVPGELRRGAEERLRRCARYSRTDAERVAL